MKPLDIGNGLVSASLTEDGSWLSLGAPHPALGFVELTALPPFDAAWRGDPAAVRRYRGWMAEDRFWFLRVEAGEPGDAAVRPLFVDGALPAWESVGADGRPAVVTWPAAGEPRIVQRRRLAARPGGRVVVRARGRLDAHPLPEITEVDPPSATGAVTRRCIDGTALVLEAPVLAARAAVRVTARGGRVGPWTPSGDEARLTVDVEDGELELVIECALGRAGRRIAQLPSPRPPTMDLLGAGRDRPDAGTLPVPAAMRERLDALARRAVAYVRGCTAVPAGAGEVCLLTDHRILPLSWTRDAYYQAALLLAAGERGVDVVAAHLRWLWARCERHDGLWMRSHRTDGTVKDAVFQADQQLYPLLELCDYRDATGELPRAPRGADAPCWWAARVRALWAALPLRDGLLPTAENPADDRAELPYQLSSQILLWAAAARLSELGDDLDLDLDLEAVARSARAAVYELFAADGPFGPQWAYETDGAGRHRLYHDANDLPTALAPLLGFCAPSDAAWAATIRFAFSPHNAAFRRGPYGGLGSLHTPGTWTLGDIQEWVVAGITGDEERAERALARLLDVASDDGMLPEAYDPQTGGAPIRPWFAWPGAVLGWLLLRHGRAPA